MPTTKTPELLGMDAVALSKKNQGKGGFLPGGHGRFSQSHRPDQSYGECHRLLLPAAQVFPFDLMQRSIGHRNRWQENGYLSPLDGGLSFRDPSRMSRRWVCKSLPGTTWIWRSRNLPILMSKQHNG